MIFDVVKRSLTSSRVLVPLEQLLGDARGSRMPDVWAARLTREAAQAAVEACPTTALALCPSKPKPGLPGAPLCPSKPTPGLPGTPVETLAGGLQLRMNYAACTGCGECIAAAPGVFVPAESLTCCGGPKAALVRRWDLDTGAEIAEDEAAMQAAGREVREILGRALNVRQLDAGSCNGCEAEIVALNNPFYDLERFNIHFVASPKHADMLLVTGPVTRNMAEAVRQTYAATPEPKLVMAVGACGCSGGIFGGSYAIAGAVDEVIPVDGYVPGCPPTPAMLLTGILQLLRRKS